MLTMELPIPAWFKYRQGEAKPVGENCYELTAPQMEPAYIRTRRTDVGWQAEVADSADGPAVFVIFISGFIVAGSALAVEMLYAPPYWVHAVIWLPLIFIVVLGGLRLVKSALMVLQYRHQAREGRLAD